MVEDQNYWDKIPEWNGEKPEDSFVVTNDKFSGRIPVTRIEKWKEFPEIFESSIFKNSGNEYVFRGHRRHDWGLTPSLGRFFENGMISEDNAEEQLRIFRKAVRGRISDHSLLNDGEEDDELWSIGQHYGLKTPLLDWTYSPYVALFFAFEKEDNLSENEDNPYRVVYVLNKSFVVDYCENIRIFEPKKDDHGRLVSQAGLFTFSPYNDTIENTIIEALVKNESDLTPEDEEFITAKHICKIYVKNECQIDCLNYLRSMNVHHASLFPDIIGAAEYSNYMLKNSIFLKSQNAPYDQEMSYDGKQSEIQKPDEQEKVRIKDKYFKNLEELLKKPLKESPIQPELLSGIVNDLSLILEEGRLIDWKERDSLQAEMKAKTRMVLRKHGYPIEARDSIVDNILDLDFETDEDEESSNE